MTLAIFICLFFFKIISFFNKYRTETKKENKTKKNTNLVLLCLVKYNIKWNYLDWKPKAYIDICEIQKPMLMLDLGKKVIFK